MAEETWFTEVLHRDFRQQIRIKDTIYTGQTAYQKVDIFENDTYGKILCLDGVFQTTESDEAYYHEMLVHPLMFSHNKPLSVLIIGGADGGALREVLRHPIGKAVLVDIDDELIDLCKHYLPSISSGAFEDSRVRVSSGDGAIFVEQTEERFDVIIVDSTDPIGPGAVLFKHNFFVNCRRILNNGGIIVTQNGVPFFQFHELANAHKSRKKIFSNAGFYVSPVPLYAGGYMAFGWASDDKNPGETKKSDLERRILSTGINSLVYNHLAHKGYFSPPKFLQDLVDF